MNISNLFNFQTTNQRANPFAAQTAKQPVTDVSPLALAVQRADQRIQTEVQDNTAQLSSFGQLKSAVSDLQMAAQALDALASADAPASATELKDALTRLVSTFNAAIATVRTAAALPGDMAASQSAKRTGKALMGAVAGDDAAASTLAALGVTVKAGAMAFNPGRVDAASEASLAQAQTALGDWGQRIDQAATQELDAHGDISDGFAKLMHHAKTLDAQQSALQSAAQATAAYPAGSPQRQAGLAAYRANAQPTSIA
jgi:flagellar capping protein FliD